MSSIVIEPSWGLSNPKIRSITVDLPAPVDPTKATLDFAFITNDKLLITLFFESG